MNNIEKTLSIIKPDAVERNLTDNIKNIFKKNNLEIKDSKKIHITKDEASEFIRYISPNLSIMIYVHIYRPTYCCYDLKELMQWRLIEN